MSGRCRLSVNSVYIVCIFFLCATALPGTMTKRRKTLSSTRSPLMRLQNSLNKVGQGRRLPAALLQVDGWGTRAGSWMTR
jgi:hypothetical protein